MGIKLTLIVFVQLFLCAICEPGDDTYDENKWCFPAKDQQREKYYLLRGSGKQCTWMCDDLLNMNVGYRYNCRGLAVYRIY